MEINKIDKNLMISKSEKEGLDYYSIPCKPFSLYGVFFDKKEKYFLRMDKSIAEKVSTNVDNLNYCTAGGRLRFSTDSENIEIEATFNNLNAMPHMPLAGSSGFSLLREDDDCLMPIQTFMPSISALKNNEKSYKINVSVKKCGVKNYILVFPLYNDINGLTIGLDKNSFVGSGKKYKDIKPIVYYGSSITQGGCASKPSNCYQSLISNWNNVDFINLGFSGSAMGEPTIANYISKIDSSLFVMDYDHNAPNKEYLEKTHKNFYIEYRKVNKNTPILFLTRPDVFNDLEVDERRDIIYNTYLFAKRSGDKNVYFLDGKDMIDKKEYAMFTSDLFHPNDYGFYKMAKTIYKKMIKINKCFK